MQQGLAACSVLAAGPLLRGCGSSPRPALAAGAKLGRSNIPNLAGTLHKTEVANDPGTGLIIPRGFSVREVARSGVAAAGSGTPWHPAPDGGASFAMPDGGWVYVSNSEVAVTGQGGVGALRFDRAGRIIANYAIATGTTNNCAGGPTPWGTWLSCEEIETGYVYECDPAGGHSAVPVPGMGMFTHEAAAVDPVHRRIYLTEDRQDGNFYRFTPTRYPRGGRADLSGGRLEVAIADGDEPRRSRALHWAPVPAPIPAINPQDPANAALPTRKQVPAATRFNGGEGCWYHEGIVYFSTKGDNRIWAVDTHAETIDLVFEAAAEQAFDPKIDRVDNLTVSPGGDVLVAEDGAAMRLLVLGPDAQPYELVNLLGQRDSEITGPAFSPDGTRLYFSSQRGPSGRNADGRTYEMRGPFFVDRVAG